MPSWLRPRSASRPPPPDGFFPNMLPPVLWVRTTRTIRLRPPAPCGPSNPTRPWAVVPFPFSADFQILHIMLDSICFHHVFPMLLTVYCIRKSMRAFRSDVARGRLRPRRRLPCGCGLRVRRCGPWVRGHRPAQRRQRGPRLREQRDPRGRPPIGYGFRTIRNLRLNS